MTEDPMNTPVRIRHHRAPGWRAPDNTAVVARPSRFGNPFTLKDAIEANMGDPRSACAAHYHEWLRVGTAGGWYQETYQIGKQVLDRRRILAELHTLRGKNLACYCPLPEPGQPDHCHAAVLLKLAADPTANRTPPDGGNPVHDDYTHTTHITCDRDHCHRPPLVAFFYPPTDTDRDTARRQQMDAVGWTDHAGRDYCPDHPPA